MRTLKSMVPGSYSYHISKIYEGIYNPYPLAKVNFESVASTYYAVRNEIDRRYVLRSRQGVADVARRIDYILKKVESWIVNGELLHNDDAEVFMDAFCAHFKEFEDMLNEMDAE